MKGENMADDDRAADMLGYLHEDLVGIKEQLKRIADHLESDGEPGEDPDNRMTVYR